MSLTRDWEYKVYPLVEKIVLRAMEYDPHEDDGEFAGDIEEWLCHFVEAIEECSNFDADKQLAPIIKELTTRKTPADLLAWQGVKL